SRRSERPQARSRPSRPPPMWSRWRRHRTCLRCDLGTSSQASAASAAAGRASTGGSRAAETVVATAAIAGWWAVDLPASLKGRTGDFESPNRGSNPGAGTSTYGIRAGLGDVSRGRFTVDGSELRDRRVEGAQLTKSELGRSPGGATVPVHHLT